MCRTVAQRRVSFGRGVKDVTRAHEVLQGDLRGFVDCLKYRKDVMSVAIGHCDADIVIGVVLSAEVSSGVAHEKHQPLTE